eukprot:TRINITY_DN273_c0_g1_i1.p1 TRINITY_DN273_c0_g1~~TRINITY_DN273_c0_g1_i1.p1  ORF type:complete len:129 (+),score=27.07 TRINITY_DN273_c0_g1_i1:40-426(+)
MSMYVTANPEKAGYLEKQSRYLKQWKKRWVIMTKDHKILSFHDNQDLTNPTEIIDLRIFNSVRSSADMTNRAFTFDVYSAEMNFSFCASTESEKEEWIRAVGKAIVLARNRSLLRDDGSEVVEEEKSS